MKIGSEHITAELKFSGEISEIKEIIRKLQEDKREERKGRKELKEAVKEFLMNAFGSFENLDDTKAIFTQQDIADMLDDFTDWVEGASWEELMEKNKKRRLARIAQQPRRGPY